jgi:hypothetical protein
MVLASASGTVPKLLDYCDYCDYRADQKLAVGPPRERW